MSSLLGSSFVSRKAMDRGSCTFWIRARSRGSVNAAPIKSLRFIFRRLFHAPSFIPGSSEQRVDFGWFHESSAGKSFQILESATRGCVYNLLAVIDSQRRVDGRGNVFGVDRAFLAPAGLHDFGSCCVGRPDNATPTDTSTGKQAGESVTIVIPPEVQSHRPHRPAELARADD